MSQLHAELSEQAAELGFESLSDAWANGYHVQYNGSRASLTLDTNREQKRAHEAWLKEKEEVLGELISVYNDINIPLDYKKYIKHAIEFVKKGEV